MVIEICCNDFTEFAIKVSWNLKVRRCRTRDESEESIARRPGSTQSRDSPWLWNQQSKTRVWENSQKDWCPLKNKKKTPGMGSSFSECCSCFTLSLLFCGRSELPFQVDSILNTEFLLIRLWSDPYYISIKAAQYFTPIMNIWGRGGENKLYVIISNHCAEAM